ncbi:MAG: hypothetical protein I3270_02590 [Candidatus Moeniiplasma glomeromycotorum]|nr:hypothetical protein [Candidatus Moeniiplasma glomeromycotorum]MCE8162565.1 hypothetical protein [Candidatus Moeniiplasma glomeromycotorum]MCE8166511.1 hypothetical protein [Candidatus Moeniiplasma glomeromycotorum]MCE8166948.1 hypothetical protein [Candidatus Moeniiplasma glomeromycotorum]
MPLIQKHNQSGILDKGSLKNRWGRSPQHLDREQLEYSAQTFFTYGTILFLALGVGASITYMTVQQLKK